MFNRQKKMKNKIIRTVLGNFFLQGATEEAKGNISETGPDAAIEKAIDGFIDRKPDLAKKIGLSK